jgi:hypothetical protein
MKYRFFLQEETDLAVKEMPLEEKYTSILDMYILETATSYAFHKDQGTLNKWLDQTVDSYRAYMGPMVDMMKTLAPGTPFKQAINQLASMQQTMQPLSEIELSWVSDREAVMRFKNCEILRRSRELVKKTGLNIEPKFFCQMDWYRHSNPHHPLQEIGMNTTCELEENGCKWTFRLLEEKQRKQRIEETEAMQRLEKGEYKCPM